MRSQPGSNPAMQVGWPGVIRVLTFEERRAFEREWDARFANPNPRRDPMSPRAGTADE